MLFNSLEFFAFLAIVLPLQAALPATLRKAFLLLASYVFYGAWDWRFLGLIALSTIVDFTVGKKMAVATDPGRRRSLLLTSLIINLSLLGYFKYAGFFVDSFTALLESFGYAPSGYALDIILPVGISFYTFQTLSYTIDVYRGELEPTNSLLDFALYVAFFPQLVAGPIERAQHFLPQIQRSPRPSDEDINSGFWLILWGILKKVVVADNLATLVDMVYSSAASPTGPEVLLATYAFAFQIYCDFSGYTDIARGVARLLGYDLMINFRLPYTAENPSDFWRRWHISLSTWLRDYLYIPLGGNRHGTANTYRNLFLTMLLGGLWHGAAWTYVAWGAYHGALLAIHRAYRSAYPAEKGDSRGRLWLRRLVMFHLACIGWMIFRANSISHFAALFTRLFSNADGGFVAAWILPFALFLSPLLAYEIYQSRSRSLEPMTRLGTLSQIAAGIALLFLITVFGEDQSAPFIYFQF